MMAIEEKLTADAWSTDSNNCVLIFKRVEYFPSLANEA